MVSRAKIFSSPGQQHDGHNFEKALEPLKIGVCKGDVQVLTSAWWEVVAPIIKSLIPTRSNRLNFPPCEGEILTPVCKPCPLRWWQVFNSKQNNHRHRCLTACFRYTTGPAEPGARRSAAGLRVWDSPPQPAVSWHLPFAGPECALVQQAAWEPRGPLLAPSSGSFGGRGESSRSLLRSCRL